MAKTKRVSMTLPLELVDDLDSVSTKLRVSRSSLISEILINNISPMREIIDTIIPHLDGDNETPILARDPQKVREYLDSFSQAISDASTEFEQNKNDLLHTMEGLKNEH